MNQMDMANTADMKPFKYGYRQAMLVLSIAICAIGETDF